MWVTAAFKAEEPITGEAARAFRDLRYQLLEAASGRK